MIDINNRNINPMTETVHISRSNQKKSLNVSSMTQKCLLLLCFLLLLIIGLGVLTGVIIFRSYHLTEDIKIKDKTIFDERAKNNQIIHHLNSLQPMDNQTIQQLSDRLQLLYDEQRKQNETIQRLTNQSLVKTTPSNKNNVPVTENDQIDPNEIEDSESTPKIGESTNE